MAEPLLPLLLDPLLLDPPLLDPLLPDPPLLDPPLLDPPLLDPLPLDAPLLDPLLLDPPPFDPLLPDPLSLVTKYAAEISGIVARVFDRAGITGLPTRSHLFRHSLATRMLRSGAGLESIGTILRHRSPATTAIYAKVDVPMLMKVAQPWSGDASC